MRSLALASIVSAILAFSAHAEDGPDCLAWNHDVSIASNVTTIGVFRAVRLDLAPSAGPVTVSEARLFTGLVAGASSLGLRAHNAAQNAPGAVLAEKAFTVKSALGWQGVAFDAPVPLAAGSTVWLTWKAPAGAQMPWAPPKPYLGQAHRISHDGGKTWVTQVFQSNSSHFKIRLTGACGCSASLKDHGAGCPGSGGHVPRLLATSCPTAGAALGVALTKGLGGSVAVVVFGDGPGDSPLFGTDCNLLVAPVRPLVLVQPLAGAGPGAGWTMLWGSLGAAASGESLVMQALVLDPGVSRGFAATAGLAIAVP